MTHTSAWVHGINKLAPHALNAWQLLQKTASGQMATQREQCRNWNTTMLLFTISQLYVNMTFCLHIEMQTSNGNNFLYCISPFLELPYYIIIFPVWLLSNGDIDTLNYCFSCISSSSIRTERCWNIHSVIIVLRYVINNVLNNDSTDDRIDFKIAVCSKSII